MTKHIAITGTTGFLGQHIANKLLQLTAHQITGLNRNPKKESINHERYHSTIMDLKDNGSIKSAIKALKKPSLFIHNAGLIHSFNPRDFYQINTKATQTIFDELKKKYYQEPLHFIYISSLAARGPMSEKGNDLSFKGPIGPYGHSKLIAEEYLRSTCPKNWTLSFIRAPVILGNLDLAFLDFFKLSQKGYRLYIGEKVPFKKYSFVCAKDLSCFLLKLIAHEHSAGEQRIYYPSYPRSFTLDLFYEAMEKFWGYENKKKRIINVPPQILHLLSHFMHLAPPEVKSRMRLSPNKASELTEYHWFIPPKEEIPPFNFEYQYGLEESVQMAMKYALDHNHL